MNKPYPVAFPNASGAVVTVDEEQIERGIAASRGSSRRRIILPLHRRQEAPVQRMVNFLQPDTYIRPHLHPREDATESITMMQGRIGFLVFDEKGGVEQMIPLGGEGEPKVIDLEPRVCHSFVVLEDDTVIFESKRGPYDTERDKTFADWSPEEGSDEAMAWIREMKKRVG